MRPLSRSALRLYVCPSCRHHLQPGRRAFASSSRPRQPPDIYDIVCVGGGPAGLGLVAALRSSPVTSKLRIALIESQDLSKTRAWNLDATQFSNRVSSLTPSSVSFLKDIGVWAHVDISRVQPYHEMHVWDGETGASISFDWSLESRSTHAQTIATMTENLNLTRGMIASIESSGNDVSIFSNTSVSEINNGEDYTDGPDLSSWPVLTLKHTSPTSNLPPPPTIATRLLVGADGINSPVRSYAAISTDGWDYDRHGVVATLNISPQGHTTGPPIRAAYQRFLPGLGGPVAFLPLPNNHATLVWSTTVRNAAYLKSLPADAFIAMVNAAFRLSMVDLKYMFTLPSSSSPESPTDFTDPASAAPSTEHADELAWRLQHTPTPSYVPPTVTSVQPGTVASFPLRHRHASTYISPRIALVGDAAHVIHPLGGQGLNLGIGDVASLFRAIEYSVRHGMDIGDLLSLERYAAERYLVNAKIGGAGDLLHKAYNVAGNGPVAWGRSFGLNMVDRLPSLKGFIMKIAAGA
ncbi:ubiquinone biosynthesis monooxygenase Coq6 [Blastomyces dermatitidis ER-3]|uniref:Ubiquinone biosynthesis monooxygenase COQ6, mitochondrial n=2 Tax=Ajellomyces dermatitidis TaxID=5039 RepID=F2T2E7_AJEDA|nr:ubiquinone biosynthesis monooxygenase Coq6 [Blastomyces dermatitidis ER-3]EEQ88206.1 ubiquinone biosynthesis monooxygenase Coq6 [Blastomyces dermatitidis ER-3]EGE77631.1 ubiquinone biosynthesis monooxygenase Coq6 [Blastomyces dermatitidis ATCC 18188]